ncbi:MAG: alanyl-tRNA editing protein [Actinomycetota bacterium]|nr:alanyl-tRNA editing protein [Actinomycetota bacterium]
MPPPTKLLYYADSYLREFAAEVVAADKEEHAVALAETAFFPTGGGQPHDTGVLEVGGERAPVVDVSKDSAGVVWHRLAPDAAVPSVGDVVHGLIDWNRRYLLMRIHTAQHILNGVIWRDYGALVTGAHMTPGEGRLDFELASMSQEFARTIEDRTNEQVALDLPVRVLFLPRSEADRDPSLLRLKADRIPRSVDPLRVIDIVGLDRQADGGTHVASTGEVGHVRVIKAESKGKANKRIRMAVDGATG